MCGGLAPPTACQGRQPVHTAQEKPTAGGTEHCTPKLAQPAWSTWQAEVCPTLTFLFLCQGIGLFCRIEKGGKYTCVCLYLCAVTQPCALLCNYLLQLQGLDMLHALFLIQRIECWRECSAICRRSASSAWAKVITHPWVTHHPDIVWWPPEHWPHQIRGKCISQLPTAALVQLFPVGFSKSCQSWKEVCVGHWYYLRSLSELLPGGMASFVFSSVGKSWEEIS